MSEEARIYDFAKAVKCHPSDDGETVVLWLETADGTSVGVSIPTEQAHSAAMALFGAGQKGREIAGIASSRVFDVEALSVESSVADRGERLLQTLHLRSKTRLSFGYSLDLALGLYDHLGRLLAASRRPPRH